MRHFWVKKILFIVVACYSLTVQAAVKIVAAENMYGEVAKQLGGNLVQVTNILSNPNQDPHLFTATPSVAKKLTNAEIIVYNGAGYDTWMDKLLEANQTKQQHVINIADLIEALPGANPHLWYQPETMQAYAKDLADTLSKLDSKNQAYYQQQLANFGQSYLQLTSKIVTLRHKYAGTPVIATEPVFEYMAEALGLKMLGRGFQQSIMNDVEPSPSQLKEVQELLQTQRVKILFYNKQVTNPLTKQLQALAKQRNIPIVGITETQPQGIDYISWMLEQLNNLDQALQYADNTSN
jgi:zinc/manganese transport system substrate-binding protein